MRYFVELAYLGKQFHGWQKQPNGISVQSELENAFSTILNHPIQVVGCGRTDAGVHATQYYLHFDFDQELPDHLQNRLNKFLPEDISIHRIFPVDAQAHARFDANYRSYAYYIHFRKNPFLKDTSLFLYNGQQLDGALLKDSARLLLDYQEFFPFCKSGHDAKTLICELYQSNWEFTGQGLIYRIAANRFLRGMVRLIVGMSLNVGLGKLPLKAVEAALQNQPGCLKAGVLNPRVCF